MDFLVGENFRFFAYWKIQQSPFELQRYWGAARREAGEQSASFDGLVYVRLQSSCVFVRGLRVAGLRLIKLQGSLCVKGLEGPSFGEHFVGHLGCGCRISFWRFNTRTGTIRISAFQSPAKHLAEHDSTALNLHADCRPRKMQPCRNRFVLYMEEFKNDPYAILKWNLIIRFYLQGCREPPDLRTPPHPTCERKRMGS